MDVIPIAAQNSRCACGIAVLVLSTGGRDYQLGEAVHGLTERYDHTGAVVAYDHLAVYPAHRC